MPNYVHTASIKSFSPVRRCEENQEDGVVRYWWLQMCLNVKHEKSQNHNTTLVSKNKGKNIQA